MNEIIIKFEISGTSQDVYVDINEDLTHYLYTTHYTYSKCKILEWNFKFLKRMADRYE